MNRQPKTLQIVLFFLFLFSGWLLPLVAPNYCAAQGPKDGLKVTAEELTKAFMANEDAARKKYGGLTRVAVEGVVKEVFVNKKGEAIVYLKGTTERMSVACDFDAQESKEAVKVKVGQKIIVVGAGNGLQAPDVLIGNCKLMASSVKPNPGETAGAQDKPQIVREKTAAGEFKIVFPKKAIHTISPPDEKDPVQQSQTYMLGEPPSKALIFAHFSIKLQIEAEKTFFENLIAEMNNNSDLKKEESVKIGTATGVHCLHQDKKMTKLFIRWLTVIKNGVVFNISATGTEAEVNGAEANAFFKSFEIDNQKATLGKAAADPPALVELKGLIAGSGFNQSKGLWAGARNPLGSNKDGGAAEPGWEKPWPATPKATFQNKVVQEGDGALFLSATVNYGRRLKLPLKHKFEVEQYVHIPNEGGLTAYFWRKPHETGPYWKFVDGKIRALDGDLKGDGKWTDLKDGYTTDAWYKVTIRVDPAKKRWSMLVDGKVVGTDLGFRTDQTELQELNYLVEHKGGAYIDAVQIRPGK